MPDQLAILRLAALLVFIGLVAVGLWLLDVVWWVVPPVMAAALLIAWTIEWVAWRGSRATTLARETAAPAAAPPPTPVEEPPPAEVFAPLARTRSEPEPPSEPEPQPEPPKPPPHSPAPKTAEQLYDHLDFVRAVDVFLNALPGASLPGGFAGKILATTHGRVVILTIVRLEVPSCSSG